MRRVTRRPMVRLDGSDTIRRPDSVVCEEPLELRIAGQSLTVTMRTPGDDFDLAVGFLATEGMVSSADDVRTVRYCAGADDDGANAYNLLDVELGPDVAPPTPSLSRRFVTSSACGLCGKDSLDEIRTRARWSVREDDVRFDPATLAGLPASLRERQRVFQRTGGLHAAGLFAADGRLLCLREDVGRHNAFDKVIGWALRARQLPLRGRVILASGRASFELTQKALMAGIPALCSVSAPSSLAIDLATEAGMTLVGFLRGEQMNVYADAHRLGL